MEMESYFRKENINIEIQTTKRSMIRIKDIDLKKINNIKNIRAITIFSHDSYWDLIACLMSVLNLINNDYFESNLIVKNDLLINIRLHPFLEEELALKKIRFELFKKTLIIHWSAAAEAPPGCFSHSQSCLRTRRRCGKPLVAL